MQPHVNTDIEFEAKFYPINKDEIRNKLQEIGATLIAPERIMRRQMFNRELNPNMTCDYVRVRDEGDRATMSSKTHAKVGGSLSDQKEVEVIVSDFADTVELLSRGGLKPGDYQENYRETWQLGSAEIDIDTWPSLEPYIEVEASNENEVRLIAEQLGCSWENKIITSVIEIYAAKYQLSREEAHQRIRYSTFNKAPF